MGRGSEAVKIVIQLVWGTLSHGDQEVDVPAPPMVLGCPFLEDLCDFPEEDGPLRCNLWVSL